MPIGRWDVDAYLGVWLFTDNPDFYPGGSARSQDAVIALQGHVSYTFKPRLWTAVDATWYRGGASTVEGGTPATAMNNSRLGATVSFPIGGSSRSSSPTVAAWSSAPGPTSALERRLSVAVVHQEVT